MNLPPDADATAWSLAVQQAWSGLTVDELHQRIAAEVPEQHRRAVAEWMRDMRRRAWNVREAKKARREA